MLEANREAHLARDARLHRRGLCQLEPAALPPVVGRDGRAAIGELAKVEDDLAHVVVLAKLVPVEEDDVQRLGRRSDLEDGLFVPLWIELLLLG